jgi:hypothetical protein
LRVSVKLSLRSSEDYSICLKLENDNRLEAFAAVLDAELQREVAARVSARTDAGESENKVAFKAVLDAEREVSARSSSRTDTGTSLGPLQMLVDAASRMSQVPLPAAHAHVHTGAVGAHQAHSVTLPRLHDILAELPSRQKQHIWSGVEYTASPSIGPHPPTPGVECGSLGAHGGRWSPLSPKAAAPNQRYSPLSAKTSSSSDKPQKRPIPRWPGHASELRIGVNDTWNSFQCANKGRSVSTAEWKAARAQLWAEHEEWTGSISEVSSHSDSHNGE